MGKFRLFLTLCSVLPLLSCGYYFQGTRNPLKDLGIETIYVEAFTNKTYRPGIEQAFTTAMVREIEKGKAFRLVNSAKAADAVLSGTVSSAEASLSSTRETRIRSDLTQQVGSEYSASVSCSVTLIERSGKTVFAQAISDRKIFPGSVLAGSSGATVPLVNESEQRLAYQTLATQMMANLYQRMIDIF